MILLQLFILLLFRAALSTAIEKIGVIYSTHGGGKEWGPQSAWDSTIQMFSNDPNSFVYKNIIWNPKFWSFVLAQDEGLAQSKKYAFEYPRIGGTDPFNSITDQQLADMMAKLTELLGEKNEKDQQYQLFTDRMGWIANDPSQLANPRGIYNPQTPGGSHVTYCGEPEDLWPGCDPERYNVDGAVERILKNDVDRLIIVDTTTTGVRFFKTFDQIREARKVVDAYNKANGKNLIVEWVNDPTDLLTESYPIQPEIWTASLGPPEVDSKVPLESRPNPFTEDPELADLYVKGVEKSIRTDIPFEKQAVVLLNHHVGGNNQYFDPKIDDTLILNRNIREAIEKRFPGLKKEEILGGWFGRKQINSDSSQKELTRLMRGENLGEAYLYETEEELPKGIDGYLYWDALEEIKNREDNIIEHIVIVFPQIFADSVLNLVELHNQIAKEIGYKNWIHWKNKDYSTYPETGHPFADYWGNWVDVECVVIPRSGRHSRRSKKEETEPCCFKMGGCPESSQPYPPERQSSTEKAIDIMDPHLAYHVSEYGHLGYDAALGPPSIDEPVQDQYTGTWAVWKPPSTDPGAGMFIAKKVYEHILMSPENGGGKVCQEGQCEEGGESA